jgi:hypothetical protein
MLSSQTFFTLEIAHPCLSAPFFSVFIRQKRVHGSTSLFKVYAYTLFASRTYIHAQNQQQQQQQRNSVKQFSILSDFVEKIQDSE